MGEKLLVCGAGQGGHAISAYAALQGHDVTLYTHSPHKADIIQEAGKKITVSGIFSGEAQLVDVTTMLDTAVSANQNIIIVTDATAHQYYAEQMAPILTDQNIVLISPGIGGALDFLRRVNHLNPDAEITVSETDTLMYACKVPSIGQSYVKVEKSNILYTTVPEDRDIGNIVKSLYPQFTNSGNSLMGLDDSPVFHIVGMVMNADRILNRENFNFYIDGITPEFAEYMWHMDEERKAVAVAVGIQPRGIRGWLNQVYDVPMATLHEMVQNTPAYQNTPEIPNRSPAPKTLFNRYLLEEVPLRAVPTVEIARIFRIPTPLYEHMIDESCKLTGIDFWKTGRTLKDMGLDHSEVRGWKNRYSD